MRARHRTQRHKRSGAGRWPLRWRLGCFALALLLFSPLAAATALADEVELALPPGVLPPEIPEDNPLTRAKVELGRRLYFDQRLSTDGTVACATCHDPASGFADPRGAPTSAGVGGQHGERNAPTVLNAALLLDQFWDGRAVGLEAQAEQPLMNPLEHGFESAEAVVQHARALPGYAEAFARAFGDDEVTLTRIAQAIASFERTLLSLDAPIDRYLAGDEGALSDAAKRGWELFNGKARCNNCHGHIEVLPLFSNEDYHNLGVGIEKFDFEAVARRAEAQVAAGTKVAELALDAAQSSELGRFVVTGEGKHIGAFKTPPLRNLGHTAPYMHDGSEATLRDVIEFYDRGGNANPWLDGGMLQLGLSEVEKADLLALLESFDSSDLHRFDGLAP